MSEKAAADEYLPPEYCECGHRYRWYEKGEPWTGIFGDLAREAGVPDDLHQKTDVVERDCPHRNGTVIEHCPKCDRQVDMWGFGPAGGMECTCWLTPRQRRRRAFWWGFLHPLGPPRPWWSKERREKWLQTHGLPWEKP